jgi:hypothetical protein
MQETTPVMTRHDPSSVAILQRYRWLPSLLLVLLAVLSGIAWRVELELRGGWAGLKWVGYFHWAVPSCVIAFVVWVLCITRVQSPGKFAVALGVYAWFAHAFVELLICYCHSGGPFGSWYFFTPRDPLARLAMGPLLRLPKLSANPQAFQVFTGLFFLCSMFVPLLFHALCRGFGLRITLGSALLSSVLFMLSWPLSMLLLDITHHRGGDDVIHALKSGFVIPFLILSLGLPILRAAK